jgi:hypothetical protein
MKKLLLVLSTVLLISEKSAAQQNYCDFETIKVIRFGVYEGTLDSAAVNPGTSGVNPSLLCAKYIRDTAMYDNIKIYPNSKLIDVTPYANNTFSTPKIKLKVYSSAPAGSMITIQLGSKMDDCYPSGVHSEYQAVTSAQNAWQQLTFTYYQSPTGSLTAATDIDKIVLLFSPGTNAQDTMYFDDITGPELLPTGMQQEQSATFKLYQNSPNPAKEETKISFQLNTSGYVSLKVFDILGNPVASLIDQYMKPGNYSAPVETATLPNGIYFYVLQVGNTKRSMRMIVSN